MCISMKQNKYSLLIVRHFLVAVVLFNTLIENLRLCSSAKDGVVLNLFLSFEQN